MYITIMVDNVLCLRYCTHNIFGIVSTSVQGNWSPLYWETLLLFDIPDSIYNQTQNHYTIMVAQWLA
jgi:hypothetical protein